MEKLSDKTQELQNSLSRTLNLLDDVNALIQSRDEAQSRATKAEEALELILMVIDETLPQLRIKNQVADALPIGPTPSTYNKRKSKNIDIWMDMKAHNISTNSLAKALCYSDSWLCKKLREDPLDPQIKSRIKKELKKLIEITEHNAKEAR